MKGKGALSISTAFINGISGMTTNDDAHIAEAFKNHYENLAKDESKPHFKEENYTKIIKEVEQIIKDEKEHPELDFNGEITTQEIEQVRLTLKHDKAAGLDELAPEMLKYGKEVITINNLDLTNDFEGIAAVISCCDLILTIDNWIAHLSSSIGKNTLIFLPKIFPTNFAIEKKSDCETIHYSCCCCLGRSEHSSQNPKYNQNRKLWRELEPKYDEIMTTFPDIKKSGNTFRTYQIENNALIIKWA